MAAECVRALHSALVRRWYGVSFQLVTAMTVAIVRSFSSWRAIEVERTAVWRSVWWRAVRCVSFFVIASAKVVSLSRLCKWNSHGGGGGGVELPECQCVSKRDAASRGVSSHAFLLPIVI